MALTDAFLATCRSAIGSLPELTTFRAALSLASTATRAQRIAAWHATYSTTTAGQSPAYELRRAIRETIQANATGAQSPLELESAYRTLSAEFVPDYAQPPSDADESAALERLLLEEQLS